MNPSAPLLVVLIVVALSLTFIAQRDTARPSGFGWLSLAIVLGSAGIAFVYSPALSKSDVLAAIALGAVTAAAAAYSGADRGALIAGIAGAAALKLVGPDSALPLRALWFSVTLGSMMLGFGGKLASLVATSGTLTALAIALGTLRSTDPAIAAVPTALAAAVGVGFAVLGKKAAGGPTAALPIGALLIAAFGAGTVFKQPILWQMTALGVVTALVYEAMTADGDNRLLRDLGALLWVATIGVAFGPGGAYGAALAALAGLFTAFALTGSVRAVIAPLVAFVIYRLLREMLPPGARTFDLFNQQALIAFLIGSLPLSLGAGTPRHPAIGAIRAGVAIVGGVAVAAIFGAAGAFGWMFGLAIGAVYRHASPEAEEPSLPIVTVGSAVAAISATLIFAAAPITREQRLPILAGLVLVLGILFAIAIRLAPKPTAEIAR